MTGHYLKHTDESPSKKSKKLTSANAGVFQLHVVPLGEIDQCLRMSIPIETVGGSPLLDWDNASDIGSTAQLCTWALFFKSDMMRHYQ
jgi:hypothetical protein